uniref:Exportin-7 n=1 Tax=Meloidogyne javanica TaxID=6303 RepID=A0A915MF38_MELJA
MYDIDFLNRLSRTLCEAVNEQDRRVAEETLSKLIDSNQCLQHCLLLLESGEQPYAQVVASGALKRLLNKKVSRYLLKYLVDRPSLPLYIQNPLCKLYAYLTKIGLLEKDQTGTFHFQMPIDQILTLAKEPTAEGTIGLKLLNSLVEEMNLEEGFESVSKQRKISGSFRDTRLLDIFIVSLDILKQAPEAKTLNDSMLSYITLALDLSFACTNYDFSGIVNDETLDEGNNVQIPTKWRPVLVEKQVVTMFFDLYFVLPEQIISKAFLTLVQLVSIRRLLFDGVDRLKFLDSFICGLKRVLESPQKLSYPDNFHQFCRILSRLKANYQVSELVKCGDQFNNLLELLTIFTQQSLQMSHLFTQSSIFYLMSFWSRMAGSLTYARVDVDLISAAIPKVCSAFIRSRVLLSENVVRGNIEDPLEDLGSVKQLMELFTVISRSDYKTSVEELVRNFEESLGVLFRQGVSNQDQLIARKQLIWLITMMAAGLNGKGSAGYGDDEDVYDGEVVFRVWKTMQMTDQRLESQQPGAVDIQLEFAYIYLMDEFRRTCITDQAVRESKLYEKLAPLGINDEVGVLRITNLKFWGKDERILNSTLALLNDLTAGYSNIRRLLKTQEIQLLLRNHAVFDFVATNEDISIMRSRTNFYSSLMRLVNIELEEEPAFFDEFMAPITVKFKEISAIFQNGNISSSVNETQIRMAVIGFMRDLRGISASCTRKQFYLNFLLWCFSNGDSNVSNLFSVMQESIKLWIDNADVVTPILKLLAELVMNRQSRLQYDMQSCMAVVLFRNIAKVICEYGTRLLSLPPVPKEHHYKQRIKNTGVCCQIIKNVLAGNYLPFGVFYIYGDTCMTDTLDITFKLFYKLQEENFLVYPKLTQAVYGFLDIVTKDCTAYISKMEEIYFIAIFRAIHRDTTAISTSCSILDQVITYVFEQLTQQPGTTSMIQLYREPEGDRWRTAFEKQPNVLYEMLVSILSQILFEEVKCQWSMSRPLLGLIILTRESGRFDECKREFLRQQPENYQMELDKVKEGI